MCFFSHCVYVLQLLSDSQINMVKVVNSVSDALNAMQKENVGLKARVKADLQRAPVRGARFKGCSNGKRNDAWLDYNILSGKIGFLLCRCSLIFILSLSLCKIIHMSLTMCMFDLLYFVPCFDLSPCYINSTVL